MRPLPFLLVLFLTTPSWALRVLVTIPPQVEWAREVGGERVEVSLLVPPGATPHTYEPSPRQLERVREAEIWALVGSGLEFEIAWGKRIRGLNPRLKVVDCSRGVEPLKGDPHIWLSLVNAQRMVENLKGGLCEVDPEGAPFYRKRATRYLERIASLHREVSTLLAPFRGRAFMTFHPAWGYFARDYGLRQLVIERGGKPPSAKALVELAKEARWMGIRVIFASPQFDRRTAEAVARSLGAEVVFLDPLSADYLESMRKAAFAILEAVR